MTRRSKQAASLLATCALALSALVLSPSSALAYDPDNAVDSSIETMPSGDVTEEDIRRSLIIGGGSNVTVRPGQPGYIETQNETVDSTAVMRPIPDSAFKVKSFWGSYWKNGYFHVVFYGSWNFDDAYIRSGDPRDASAVAVTGFPASCWRLATDSVVTKDYQGNSTNKKSRYGVGQLYSIFNINDSVSGFKLLTDNGLHALDYKRVGSGADCNKTKAGSFYFEHNQGADTTWTASVNVGAFNLAYNGAPPAVLRKAAKYNYY